MKTFLTVLLAVFPVIGSAWASSSTSPKSFSAQGSRKDLAMHIHMVHMREVDLREGKAVAEFSFHNAGQAPLTISRIKPSCGCVTVRMQEQEAFKPGESHKFYVEVDTAGETSGLHEYTIDVEYHTDARKTAEHEQVLFRVEVPEKKVTVKPRALIFYQLSEQKTKQTVTLTDFRNRSHFEVLEIASSLDSIQIENQQVSQDEHGHLQITFDVSVSGKVSSGRQTQQIKVTTTDDEFSVINIPVLLYGPQEEIQRN
ncbi:DUF1573 domain-containing protein [Rubinisphaera sp.]|uniref:DUF1573 domain-containing protein n=1 Tax=Rubinisphaera sp. TaxID=2024857 RepID=UPI0025D8BD92|nr:DUF1573 domain-containing protein [Rubinisphaera sp.]